MVTIYHIHSAIFNVLNVQYNIFNQLKAKSENYDSNELAYFIKWQFISFCVFQCCLNIYLFFRFLKILNYEIKLHKPITFSKVIERNWCWYKMSCIATDCNIMNAFKSIKWWFIENNHNTAIKVLIKNHFSSIL